MPPRGAPAVKRGTKDTASVERVVGGREEALEQGQGGEATVNQNDGSPRTNTTRTAQGRTAARKGGASRTSRPSASAPSACEKRAAGANPPPKHACAPGSTEGCVLVESDGQRVCTLTGIVKDSVLQSGDTFDERENRRKYAAREVAFGRQHAANSFASENYKYTRASEQGADLVALEADSMRNKSCGEGGLGYHKPGGGGRRRVVENAVGAFVESTTRMLFTADNTASDRKVVAGVVSHLRATKEAQVADTLRFSGTTCPSGVAEVEWLMAHPLFQAVVGVLRKHMVGVRDNLVNRVLFGGFSDTSLGAPAVERYQRIVDRQSELPAHPPPARRLQSE